MSILCIYLFSIIASTALILTLFGLIFTNATKKKPTKYVSKKKPITLVSAIKFKKFDEAKKLLEDGADVNEIKFGRSAFEHAAVLNQDFAHYMIDNYNIKFEPNILSKINSWSTNIKPALVGKILDFGLNINYMTKINPSALYFAIRNRNVELTKYLLENGASKDVLDGIHTDAKKFAEYIQSSFVSSYDKDDVKIQAIIDML